MTRPPRVSDMGETLWTLIDQQGNEVTLACNVPGGMLVRVDVTEGPWHGDETHLSVSVAVSTVFVPNATVDQWRIALGWDGEGSP